MAAQPGIVQRVADGEAVIAVTAAAGCGACSKRGACGIGTLAAAGSPRELRFAAPAGLRAGDTVTVTVDDRHLLPAALLGYLLPATLMIAGAMAGDALAVAHQASELWSPAGALLGLALGIALLRILQRRRVGCLPQIAVTPRS